MRITCDSCGAKYNVADEKVQGKTVKIRCKKCSNVILVNAKTDASFAAEAPLAETPITESAAAVYHVNIAENDQRELPIGELVAGYREGWITNDMFVWTDGMGDWLPLEQVDAIMEALGHGALPVPGPSAEARRLRRDDGREGRDLFAAPAGSDPFAFPSSSSQPATEAAEVAHPSGPSPAAFGEAPGLTGERGEDSVLFNVGALAVKQPEAPSKENSGVIDLRALVAANEQKTTAAVEASEAPVLSLFAAAPSPFDSQAGVSHVRSQEAKPQSRLAAAIGLAGVALLIASGVAAVALVNKPVAVAAPPHAPVAAAPAALPAKVNEVVQPKAEPASLVSLDDPNEKKNVARPGPLAVARPTPRPTVAPGDAPTPPPVVVKKPSGGGDPCGGDLTCMMRNSIKKRPK